MDFLSKECRAVIFEDSMFKYPDLDDSDKAKFKMITHLNEIYYLAVHGDSKESVHDLILNFTSWNDVVYFYTIPLTDLNHENLIMSHPQKVAVDANDHRNYIVASVLDDGYQQNKDIP